MTSKLLLLSGRIKDTGCTTQTEYKTYVVNVSALSHLFSLRFEKFYWLSQPNLTGSLSINSRWMLNIVLRS